MSHAITKQIFNPTYGNVEQIYEVLLSQNINNLFIRSTHRHKISSFIVTSHRVRFCVCSPFLAVKISSDRNVYLSFENNACDITLKIDFGYTSPIGKRHLHMRSISILCAIGNMQGIRRIT